VTISWHRGRRSCPGPGRRSAYACPARSRPRCRRGRRSPACSCRSPAWRPSPGSAPSARPRPQAPLALAHLLGDVGGQDLGLEASPSTTSSIASPTISSKRDMCTPACWGLRSTKHSKLGVEEVLGPVGLDPDHLLDPRSPRPGRLTWVAGSDAWTSAEVAVAGSGGASGHRAHEA
jgi:hypothetical protein